MRLIGYWRDDGWMGEFTCPTSGAMPEHGWQPVVLMSDAIEGNKLIRNAVLALRDTEIAEIACTGSHAPVEDALGRLFELVPNAKVSGVPPQD